MSMAPLESPPALITYEQTVELKYSLNKIAAAKSNIGFFGTICIISVFATISAFVLSLPALEFIGALVAAGAAGTTIRSDFQLRRTRRTYEADFNRECNNLVNTLNIPASRDGTWSLERPQWRTDGSLRFDAAHYELGTHTVTIFEPLGSQSTLRIQQLPDEQPLLPDSMGRIVFQRIWCQRISGRPDVVRLCFDGPTLLVENPDTFVPAPVIDLVATDPPMTELLPPTNCTTTDAA